MWTGNEKSTREDGKKSAHLEVQSPTIYKHTQKLKTGLGIMYDTGKHHWKFGFPGQLNSRTDKPHDAYIIIIITFQTRMWANAQRDGRPAKYRWRPLFNAAKFGWRPPLDAVQ